MHLSALLKAYLLSYLVILLDALFSLSHCKDAVACAVSDHNIGIDVESIAPYNPDVARRVCTATELEMLEQSANKDTDFIKLWTMKEAISKYEGVGLSCPFAEIVTDRYSLSTHCAENKVVLTICHGIKTSEPIPDIIIKKGIL